MQIIMTEELGNQLREIRKENKVKAHDLSDHLKKSKTYISKLESNGIKRIEHEQLLKIFKFIFKDKGSFETRFQEFLDKCMVNLSEDEIMRRVWLNNFDTVISKIPIPSELIDYCNEKISEIGVPLDEIVERINKNEDLTDETPPSNHPINEWYDMGDHLSIYMSVPIERYRDILEQKETISNYVTVFSLVYTIMKYIHPSTVEAEKNARLILKKYKYFSARERKRALTEAHTQEEINSILTDFNKINADIIKKLNAFFSFFSDYNVRYTNEKLYKLLENFMEDKSLAMAFVGVSLKDLKNLSMDIKKEFIEDVKGLIEEYSKKSKEDTPELI